MSTTLHELSSALPLPEFDLFGVPPTQTMVDRDLLTEHRAIATLEPSSFIQFEIPTAIDEYLRFDDMYIYMKVKPKCSPINGEKTVDWSKIGVVNNLLHSAIKQVVFIGDTQITSSPSTYSFRAYFDTFLGYYNDAKTSHLSQALWFNDENDKMPNAVISKTQKYINGNEKELMGKLHLDMTYQSKLLLGGCKTTVRLLLNDPKFYFLTQDGYMPDMQFNDAALFVHRARVNPKLVEAHNMALQVATAKYFITHVKVKACTIQSGTFEANIDNVHSGQHVRRIFVAFVRNDAYCGDYAKNPFYFENCKINQICAFLDGVQYPSKSFTHDFDNNLNIRELHSLYESLNMLNTDATINVNRDNYSNGNTIFGFNFAPDLSNGCGSTGHLNPIKCGALRLQVRFKEALTIPMTALVYCEFDKVIEVDASRNGLIDFI